eukprot:8826691-Pyramimonas_sp.AAC.1
MKPKDPNETDEWLRARVLEDTEMHRLARNRDNLKCESQRKDSAVLYAAWEKGLCKHGGRCEALRAGPAGPPRCASSPGPRRQARGGARGRLGKTNRGGIGYG